MFMYLFRNISEEEDPMARPVLIDFSAEWCGPCKRQAPILEDLKQRMGDSVEFRMIDVDQNIEEAIKYQIRVVPTLVIEKDGQVKQRLEGVTGAAELQALLTPLID
jgi:thioredoxin 1